MTVPKPCVADVDEVSSAQRIPSSLIQDNSIVQEDDMEKMVKEHHKRARSAGTGTKGAERRNIRRVSTGEGMSSMASSMNIAADTLANAMHEVAMTLRPTDVAVATPQHANATANPNVMTAISLIESNKGLSDNEFSDVAQCITVNPTIATVYVSMNNQSMWSRYIQKQVATCHCLEDI